MPINQIHIRWQKDQVEKEILIVRDFTSDNKQIYWLGEIRETRWPFQKQEFIFQKDDAKKATFEIGQKLEENDKVRVMMICIGKKKVTLQQVDLFLAGIFPPSVFNPQNITLDEFSSIHFNIGSTF